MKIYRNGVEIYDLQIDNKTVINRRLSVENTLTIEYESLVAIVLAIGDYVNIGDEKYVINELPSYTLTGGKYKYSIILKGWLHFLENFMMPDEGRDDFFYFGALYDHLDYLLSVLNDKQPGWSIVKPNMATISSTPKNLNYAGCSILAAINKLCGADEGYGIEMDIKGQEITFAKAIRRETALTFEYGHDKGLYKISRDKLKNGKLYTRIYGYGGTTNMLDGKRLSFDEKYIEKNIALYGLRENKVKFDEIYPRRNGKITSDAQIVAVGRANWTVADSTLDFDLNKQIVEGAVISFNTGDCAGIEFELVTYDAIAKIITFKEYADTSQSPAYVLPSAVRFPRSGDEYSFKNIIMPESYITAAKAELKQATQEYTDKNSVPAHPYTIDCDPRYIKRLEFIPQIGDVVKIIDVPMGLEASIRITAIEYPALYPHKVKLTISDDIIVSTAIIQTIETKKNKDKIEIIDRRAEVSARKQNKALQELSNYLLDTEGYFDTDKFKALSIEARMLAIGMQAQNFTLSGIRVTPNSGNLTTVVVTSGTLTHASLEVAGLGSSWTITGKTLSAPDTSKAYYIYAKCSKNTLSGTIEISETELKVEHFPNFYVFNLGVLYPQRTGESWRDYSATYGVTSIVGDQIYGGGIKALDGFNFVDLRAAAENGRFRLGSRSGGCIDYGVTEPDTLTLLNTKLVSRGGNSSYAPVYRGAWTNAELYYIGETVTYNGSMYQCKADTPTAGIMPLNTQYWDKTVSKGTDGQNGQDGAPGDKGDKGDVGEMLSAGKMLYRDPEFREGFNSIYVYNNANNGMVTMTRIAKPADCPTTSTYCLEINTIGPAEPNRGGFYQAINSRANAVFIQRIVAKIPVGCYLVNHANSLGTGATDSFITSTVGTGRYETYLRKVICGASGPFSTGGHIALVADSVPVTWYLASSTVYDVTDTEKYDQAITSAQQAAENYALTKANLAEVTAKAHADGIVTAEEQRAIADATTKANYAREAAIAAAKEFDEVIKVGTRNYIAKQFLLDFNKIQAGVTVVGKDTDGIYYALNVGLLYTYVSVNATKDIFAGKIKYKPNTQYTLSVKWKLPAVQSHTGLIIYIRYTDGTSSAINIDQTQTVVVTQSIISDFGKTINGIITTYGTGPYTYIYDIQLTEGNKIVDFIKAQEDIVTDAVNLIPNSSFTQGITGYTPNQYVTLTTQNGYLHATTSQTSSTPGVRFPKIYLEAGIYTFKIKLDRINIGRYYFSVYTPDVFREVDTASIDTTPLVDNYTVKYAIPVSGEYIIIAIWLASPDCSTGINIYNSCLCKGDVNILNYPLTPSDLISSAVESSAKNLGFTKIENGLIQSSHIKLMQPGGAESAGISGITNKQTPAQKFLPAFWGGGTYANAAMGKTPLMLDHSGNGKIGALNIEPDGNVFMKDAAGVPRVEWNASEIDLLSVIKNKAYSSVGATISGSSRTTYGTTNLAGQIYVANNGSKLTISSSWHISIEAERIGPHASSSASLDIYKDGAYYSSVAHIAVDLMDDMSASIQSNISAEFNSVSVGTYTFRLNFNPDGRDILMESVNISSISVTATYTTDQKRFKFGLNGLIAFYDKFKYMYLNEADGEVFFSLAGKTDMPGVLAAYSVNSSGAITRRWGGKVVLYGNANRVSTGIFDIPHLIGHTDYIVNANVVSPSGTSIAMIGQKYNNSVRVVIRDLVNDLVNMDFDVIITGRNA